MADSKSNPPPDYEKAAAEHGLPSRPAGPVRRGPLPLNLPIIKHLNSNRVILASASPRRKALLQQVCFPLLCLLVEKYKFAHYRLSSRWG